jgi:hypothetical protein
MQRRLKPVFLRGVLAVGLSIAAISAAATQAVGFEGDIRFEQGRLVLVDAVDTGMQCVLADRAAPPALRAERKARG